MAFGAEDSKVRQAPLLQAKLQRGSENAKTVSDAAPKADAGGFGKIPRRTRDLAKPVAKINNLRQHLVVEHKVIAIGFQRQRIQNGSRKSPVAGVVLRDLVLKQ